MEEFWIMCKILTCGRTYNDNAPNEFLKFDHSVAIGSFLINSTRDKKLPLKEKFMKPIFREMHNLVTRVLLLRRENSDELLIKYFIVMWMITRNF